MTRVQVKVFHAASLLWGRHAPRVTIKNAVKRILERIDRGETTIHVLFDTGCPCAAERIRTALVASGRFGDTILKGNTIDALVIGRRRRSA